MYKLINKILTSFSRFSLDFGNFRVFNNFLVLIKDFEVPDMSFIVSVNLLYPAMLKTNFISVFGELVNLKISLKQK